MTGSRPAHPRPRLSIIPALLTVMLLPAWTASAEDFDWRNVNGQNWVTSVKDQFGGTCWDFAACGALEAKYMLTRNDNTYQPDVSEQQVCWETNPDMGGTDGGRVWEALDYFTSHGVVLDSECPYQSSSPDVGIPPYWPLAAGWQNRVFKSTSNTNRISEGTNLNYVKSCLKKYGPLTMYMRADDDFYIPSPGSYRGGHRVVIVGFHDDASVPGGGYWIIKNSWGSGWNSGGPGTVNHGYGAVAYADQPSYEEPFWPWDDPNRDICGINGTVYYTGSMATVTWKGGSGTWSSGGSNWSGVDQYGTALPSYAWQNRETSATFNASSGTNITLSGTVIAHALTISSGATGYVFNGTSGGALTVTAGGITANETVTINAPVTIGAPQTWTVANGKWLTIGGDLHTIISNLTIAGVADTLITGSIDGGGALNTMGVAPGTITLTSGAYLWLNGAADYSVNINASSSSHGISFSQPAGVVGHCYGVISGGGWIDKRDRGTIVLHAANTYTNWTSIYDGGAVQADSGAGLPSASLLNLNGGVLQSNGTTTFTRSLGTSGSNKFQWNTYGGGFAGGAGPMTVRIGGGTDIVTWGTTVGTNIVGPLKFGSTTAADSVTFENAIDLNAEERTFYVEDNPNASGDVAVISGVITDVQGFDTDVWSGAIRKTGPGTLILTARNENGQGDGSRGNTTIADGVLQADRDLGLSGWAGLILDGGVLQSNSDITYAEPLWEYGGATSRRVRWKSGGFSAGGGKMTVNIGGAATPQTVNFGDADGTHGIAGVLKMSSNTAHYETELQNGLNLAGGSRTIQVDDNPFDAADFATVSGTISGTGSWTKMGAGTLYLRGAGNTFSGQTTVSEGTVWLDKSSGAAIPGNLNINGDGTGNVYVRLSRDEQIANSAVVSFSNALSSYSRLYLEGHTETVAGISCPDDRGIIQNGQLVVNNPADCFYAGYLRYATSVEKRGAGTLTLFGSHIYYTGGTTVSGGKLVLQDTTHSTFLPTSITNNATLEFSTNSTDVDFSGRISGSGELTKSGSYALTLSGSSGNTYTGTTTVSRGTVYLDKESGAAIPGNLDIAGTGNNVYVYPNRDEQIADSSVISFSNTSNYARFYLNGHTETVAGISCSDGRGIIQDGNLIVNNSASYFYNGYMRNYGGTVVSLQKGGSGTLTLAGSHIYYMGGTTINGGKLVLQDTTNSSYRAADITNNATLEFDTATTNIDFIGTISGTGALRKTGSNKLTLRSAANSYSGSTNVYDGILAAASTAVPGPIAIRSGAAFAPGDVDVVDSVTTGPTTWYGGGEYLFDINDADGTAGVNWDLWNISGNLSITPRFTVSVTTLSGTSAGEMVDFDNQLSYSWLLAQTMGTISGFGYLDLDATGFQNDLAPAGYLHLSQSTNYKQLFLSYSLSVPGDTNHDNRVDKTDAAVLAAHWGQTGGWTDGDFNGDGIVNAADASILAANWGYHGTQSESNPVPEPTTFALLATGLFGLLTRARRRPARTRTYPGSFGCSPR